MEYPVKFETSQDISYSPIKQETPESSDVKEIDYGLKKHQDKSPGAERLASKEHSCTTCEYITCNKSNLNRHMTSKQHMDALMKKEVNGTDSIEEDSMMKDMKDHPCDHCDFIYKYNPDQTGMRLCKLALSRHMNDKHAEFKLKCDQCEKTVWTQKQLEVHKTKHDYSTADGNYTCDQCGYKCKHSFTLRIHINGVHLGLKPHQCELCPAAFSVKGALTMHKLSHTDVRNFPCQFCEKAFHTKANLITHIRTHTGEKPFTCDVCGKSFSDQAYFAKHKRKHITNASGQHVKDFNCEICGKGFSKKAYFQSHVTSHQNQSDGKAIKYSNEFKMEAVVKAKDVGVRQAAAAMSMNVKTLSNWVRLSVHPHTCSLCGKAFSYSAQLKNHVLTHKTEKANIRYEEAFKEEVAQYALGQSLKEAIKKYQLPHSTVNSWVQLISNPRSCHLCGKSFGKDSTVRRHIEQVHRDTQEGEEEKYRRAGEIQNTQSFSDYLDDHHLLPSEEQIKERIREKERKQEEKEKFAHLAQEILFREKYMKDKNVDDVQAVVAVMKREDADELEPAVCSPFDCLTDGKDNKESALSGTVKIEPGQGEVS